jgi:hypothetical protein
MKKVCVWNLCLFLASGFCVTSEAAIKALKVNEVEAAKVYNPDVPDKPVAIISTIGPRVKTFDEAVNFCKKLGKTEQEWRLPTEVELGGMMLVLTYGEMDQNILAKTAFSFMSMDEEAMLQSEYLVGTTFWSLGRKSSSEFAGTDKATIILNGFPGFPPTVFFSLSSPKSDLTEDVYKTSRFRDGYHSIPFETLPKEVAPFCVLNDKAPEFSNY